MPVHVRPNTGKGRASEVEGGRIFGLPIVILGWVDSFFQSRIKEIGRIMATPRKISFSFEGQRASALIIRVV